MDKRTNEKGKDEEQKPQFIIPRHISTEMRRWISGLVEEWDFSADEFKILLLAVNSWDLAERCRIVITKKSPVYIDRFGSPKARPECAVLRDSRIGFLRCMAALNLVTEEPEEEEQVKRPYANFRRTPEWVRVLAEKASAVPSRNDARKDDSDEVLE